MMEQAERRQSARLFFALWPNEAVRQQLAAHRPDTGQAVPTENLHLTLVFLGLVDSVQQRQLVEAAAEIAIEPFQLRLERLEHWRRSRMTWLMLDATPPGLLSLHQQLNAAAAAAGLVVEQRCYKPHVTLARKAPPVSAHSIKPIDWAVMDFCLVESATQASGSQYTVRQHWPLQAEVGSAVGGAGATVE